MRVQQRRHWDCINVIERADLHFWHEQELRAAVRMDLMYLPLTNTRRFDLNYFAGADERKKMLEKATSHLMETESTNPEPIPKIEKSLR